MSVAIAEARVTVQDVTHRPYFTVAIFACRLCFVAIVLTRIDMDKKEEGGYGRGAVAGGREGGGGSVSEMEGVRVCGWEPQG